MSETKWCVITGAPSSGKTTLVKALERAGYRVVHEVARTIIETKMEQGLTLEEIRADKESFQSLVLNAKIAAEAGLPRDKVVFLDRAVPDSIAYFRLAGLDPEPALAKSPRHRYSKVFLLDRLPYRKDHLRRENQEAAARLERCLEESYSRLGYEVIRIGVMPVKERLRLVVEEMEKR